MAKKVFTDESLSTLVSEIKGYTDEAVSTKADSGHSHNAASTSAAGFMSKDDKTKLNGIATGAEVNQNAFSNVVVGSTTISADSKTDSLTIAAGTGISVAGDATNDKVTITNSGVRSISTGTSNGTISVDTNGSSANVAVKGLGSAAYTASTAYDAAGTAQTKADAALASANSYTNDQISEIEENFGNIILMMYSNDFDEDAGVLPAIREIANSEATAVKNALLNGAGTAFDTLKELGDLIVDNQDAIEALETIASGKANATHTHAISDVTSLQTALNNKADVSHGTHVSYSNADPLMDGTASAGSSSSVARSNHRHPTDTSRAAKTDLDALTTTVSGKANATHSHSISDVTNLQSTLDGKAASGHTHTYSDVGAAPASHSHSSYVNQNAFSNVTVGSTTIAADTTTDTLTLVAGSNVTITPDATNDKITIAATDTTYSAAGSALGLVKSGGDVTISSGVITVNDDSHAHVISNVDGLQAALDAKAASSHTHDYAAIDHTHSAATTSAAGFMSTIDKSKLNYSNIAYGTCSTAADTAAKVVSVSGNSNWSLTAGSIVHVFFSETNTASNPTLNVNSTGAKNIYYGASQITTSSLGYAGTASRLMTFVYDGTQYRFAGWGYDSNTTYTNVKLGHGYATCSTAEATTAKVGTLSSYTLTTGGIVAVKFTYAVPASATLNINSKGAKAIYHRGAAIAANVIKAGDTATFIYNGSQYHLLSVDRDEDTTYSLSKLGCCNGLCETAEATVAKTVSDSDFVLTKGGVSYIKFMYAVPAGATLNINNTGAKAILHKASSAIKAGVIKANDIATLVYDGTSYHLVGIDRGATNDYVHPTYTAKSSGLYKVTVDSTGHVSAATAVAKADITGLGIPAQDTTYSAATQSAAGLMPAADKAKVDGLLTPITTAGTGSAYTATVAGITALTAGVSFVMVPHVVSAAVSPTLNVNSLGAKSIKRRLSNLATSVQNGYTTTWLAANQPFRMTYDGTYWIAEGMNKPVAADLYGTVAIDKGGTGATTAADALTALGGSGVTLNGTSKVGSTASFYAPTDAGTKGYILSSNGSGAPIWADPNSQHIHQGTSLNPSAVEINPGSGATHGGYIDFHFGGDTGDYTTRIIEEQSGQLQVEGTMQVLDTSSTASGARVRNIMVSTTDLTAGTSSLATGRIWLCYE